MKKLLDAFLELPTWQGIALISWTVLMVTLLCLWIARRSYTRGLQDALNQLEARFEKSSRKERSI